MRLSLFQPVQSKMITQRFGEDLTCIDSATRTNCISRVSGKICPPGYESLYISSGLKGHNGIDFKTEHKQFVYAATDGFVYKLVSEDRRGIGVEIISKNWFRLESIERVYRVKTRYWHLDSYVVKKGQKVKAGELIGYADNTGLSSGDHLHFELKPVRRKFLRRFKNAFQNNGYFGAIDPKPYFGD